MKINFGLTKLRKFQKSELKIKICIKKKTNYVFKNEKNKNINFL